QAEAYLSKLQEYENAIPAAWDQHALFLAGGLTLPEHDAFDNTVRTDFMQPLAQPPTDMQDTIVDRTDFSSGVDATHVGDIENLLNEGQSIMYFDGHGATFTTDIAFPDPSILQNKGLYPLLMTLTCHTGAFAEPTLTTINQSYVEVPNAGSVQAYGTTGLGDITYDDPFTLVWIGLMRSFDSTHDTTRPENINQLQLLSAAKISQIGIAAGGEATTTHNETLQNSMLGDGATGFALRPQPELAVYSNEIHAYPQADTVPETNLIVSDSTFTIRALIHNYGYAASRPVVIELTDRTPNGFPTTIFDTLPGILTSAYASATFGLTQQSIGTHTISIVIDPNRQFPESYLGDSSASIQIRVNGISTSPFYPYEGSRAMCDLGPTVHFIVLTPPASNANDLVQIQLDTTEAFSSPVLDRKTNVGAGYYVTFDLPLPASPVPTSSVYWWRTRLIRTNGDTTIWQPSTFSTAIASRPEFSYTSPEQLFSTAINGLGINSRGFLSLLQQDTLRLEAISLGLLDSEVGQSSTPFAQVDLNGRTYWQDSGTYNGLPFRSGFIILIWTPDGSQIDTDYQFEMEYPQIGDSVFETTMARAFDSVIAGIPTGRRVMVLTVGSVDFAQYFFPKTEPEMQTLGSIQGMVPMTYDGSYALIGTKGSSPGTAKEAFAPMASSGAHVFDTIITSGTSGIAETPYTAVAKDYGSLTWSGDPISAGNDIAFTVLGARRDGSGVDVVDTFPASSGNAFPLSNIDPRTYDQLALHMAFTRTANTTQSPAVSGIAIQYDPAPEWTFASDSISCTPEITNTGGTIIATYSPSTLTCMPGDSVLILLVRQSQGKIDTPSTHFVPVIPGHSSIELSDTLSTQNELGAVSLTATVNPNEGVNEQLLFNNTINGSYSIVRDTMAPSGEVLFADPTDKIDQHVSDCGYVSANSIIHIQLLSNNPLRDTSASSISANFVDESNTSLVFPVSATNPNGFNVQFKSFPSGPLQALMTIIPSSPFAAGQWYMQAFVRDASGNTDTVEQCFQVSDVNGLEEVMNYPNPFKESTDFTFVLKSDAPANLKIVVYTIAGRKIRTLTPTTLHAGFNAVEWDGRDERGNEVANGTYLYRVVINGTNGDSVSQAVSQTAVRAR
ncbi:MAG TPA: C25 family cysteine peptidase, partial [Candidatus Kapabacteria bacterium]